MFVSIRANNTFGKPRVVTPSARSAGPELPYPVERLWFVMRFNETLGVDFFVV